MKFRLLRADEIEARVAQVTDKYVRVLLYKDSRCDMALLDETVGAMNWKREHTRDNRNCIVSIWDPDKGEWVSKEDTGTESNTEAEKGLASDSFKRSCVNWGIGRELYTAPDITFWAPAEANIKEWKGRASTFDKFFVKDIEYDEDKRRITSVTVVNASNGTEKTFKPGVQKKKRQTKQTKQTITPEDAEELAGIVAKSQFGSKSVLAHYKVDAFTDLTP